MKLTNYQREAITAAIFQDVPVAKDEDIVAAVQKELVKAMTPACRRLYQVSPKALRTDSTYDISNHRNNMRFVIGDADFREVLKPWKEARDRYCEAKAKLSRAIAGCATLKQLNELLPEFADYFPTENAPTKNLPAVANLVSDLVNLGWKGAVK